MICISSSSYSPFIIFSRTMNQLACIQKDVHRHLYEHSVEVPEHPVYPRFSDIAVNMKYVGACIKNKVDQK